MLSTILCVLHIYIYKTLSNLQMSKEMLLVLQMRRLSGLLKSTTCKCRGEGMSSAPSNSKASASSTVSRCWQVPPAWGLCLALAQYHPRAVRIKFKFISFKWPRAWLSTDWAPWCWPHTLCLDSRSLLLSYLFSAFCLPFWIPGCFF